MRGGWCNFIYWKREKKNSFWAKASVEYQKAFGRKDGFVTSSALKNHYTNYCVKSELCLLFVKFLF